MRLRAPGPRDLEAVHAVFDARERADVGRSDFTIADLRDEWALSGFDLAADARVVVDETGRIVGYGLVRRPGALGMIDPSAEGAGAGTVLIEWLEERERELGRPVHRQYVASTNASAERLLSARGYSLIRGNWRMVRALDGSVPAAEPPVGVELRPVRPDDFAVLHALDARAFADAPGWEPDSPTAFREELMQAHDSAPELSSAAFAEGRLAGFALSKRWSEENAGYLAVLAVDPQAQGRGIGRALLLRTFELFARAGLGEAQLDVSSVNPRALGLYKGAGMSPRFRYDIWERPLA